MLIKTLVFALPEYFQKGNPMRNHYVSTFTRGFLNRRLMGCPLHIFYRQLDFSYEPGVANEILENKPKSCSAVA